MTKEQYAQEKETLERLHHEAILGLQKRYALANNPYKIDDIVTDHIGSIQVKKITVHGSMNYLPECIYSGIELKKDGTPMKKQEGRRVYQSNLGKK